MSSKIFKFNIKKKKKSPIQTQEYVKKRLNGFTEITNFRNIEQGTFIRYITLKNKKPKIFHGGIYKYNKSDFIILSMKNRTWSVPKAFYNKNSDIIFRSKFFSKPKKDKNNIIIQNLNNKIILLVKKINEMDQDLNDLYEDS